MEISLRSINRILNEELWCAKKVEVHRLEGAQRQQRVERCRRLLERFPTMSSSDDIVSMDEKVFELEHQPNKQNERVYVPLGAKKFEVPPER